ncbi:MAG: hypothetical protein Q9183_004267, partial [Haloplaca sp. 2 TL-2023]
TRCRDGASAQVFSFFDGFFPKVTVQCAILTSNHVESIQSRASLFQLLELFGGTARGHWGIAEPLVAKYFDTVDPVYPALHRETFENDYRHFWSLEAHERGNADASLVALIFVMLAMGTQFIELPSLEEKVQTSEFYVSASHQALRLFSYLGRPSIRSIQTMVLITYFLMNDNHASDAWAFAGIIARQAYAMGLNRDPSIAKPGAPPLETQQRRKLWQAIFIQDTFLSVIVKLPPTVTHTDVRIEDVTDIQDACFENEASDTSFLRSMWSLASMAQGTICTPRSLDRAICKTPAERARLVGHFQGLYRSLPGYIGGGA